MAGPMDWSNPISAMIGGIFGGSGQQQANAQNEHLDRLNKNWMEYMSSSAHRREVYDLQQAGLNPILSANSGASSPQSSAPIMGNVGAAAVTGAKEAFAMKQGMDKLKGEVGLINDQRNLLKSQKTKTEKESLAITQDILTKDLVNNVSESVGNTYKGVKEGASNLGQWIKRKLLDDKKPERYEIIDLNEDLHRQQELNKKMDKHGIPGFRKK